MTFAPVTSIDTPLTTGLLNSVNVSPCTRAEPRLVTVTGPMPELIRVPLTTTLSLAGDPDLFTSMPRPPASETLLLIVSVPTELPGTKMPPGRTVTGPLTLPVPPSAAFVATVTAPEPSWPLT